MWKSLSTPRHIDKHLLVSYVCTLLVLKKKKNSVINTDGYIWERLVLGFSLEVVGGPPRRPEEAEVLFYEPRSSSVSLPLTWSLLWGPGPSEFSMFCFIFLGRSKVSRPGNECPVSVEYSSLLRLRNHGVSWVFTFILFIQVLLGRGQTCWPFVFVNKVLLEHSHIHLLHIACGCFCFTTAELNNRERMAFRATRIFYLAVYGRLLPTLL